MNTVLRRGEALALTPSDVELDGKASTSAGRSPGRLCLVVTEPKTEKSRRVIHLSPTSERVLKAVRLRRQREDRLKAGSGLGDDGLRLHDRDRRAVRPEERAAGVEGGRGDGRGFPASVCTRFGTPRLR